MFDAYLQGLFYFFLWVAVETEASVWENTLSWENPWNVGCL